MESDLEKFATIQNEFEPLSKSSDGPVPPGGGAGIVALARGGIQGVIETGLGLLGDGVESSDKVDENNMRYVEWLMEKYQKIWQSEGKAKKDILQELEPKVDKYMGKADLNGYGNMDMGIGPGGAGVWA